MVFLIDTDIDMPCECDPQRIRSFYSFRSLFPFNMQHAILLPYFVRFVHVPLYVCSFVFR